MHILGVVSKYLFDNDIPVTQRVSDGIVDREEFFFRGNSGFMVGVDIWEAMKLIGQTAEEEA